MAGRKRMNEPYRLHRHDDGVVPRRAGRWKTADDGMFEAVVDMRLATCSCPAGITMRRLENIPEPGLDTGSDHRFADSFEHSSLRQGPAPAQRQQCRCRPDDRRGSEVVAKGDRGSVAHPWRVL